MNTFDQATVGPGDQEALEDIVREWVTENRDLLDAGSIGNPKTLAPALLLWASGILGVHRNQSALASGVSVPRL